MFEAYVKGIKNWKRWDGRTRRRDYWLYSICNYLIALAAVSLAMLMSFLELTTLSVFAWIAAVGYCFLQAVPTIAITIRRLHDTNRGGLYYFISCIPYIGSIWFFVLMVLKGTPGRNKFGPDPKDEFFGQENATSYGDYPNFRGE